MNSQKFPTFLVIARIWIRLYCNHQMHNLNIYIERDVMNESIPNWFLQKLLLVLCTLIWFTLLRETEHKLRFHG